MPNLESHPSEPSPATSRNASPRTAHAVSANVEADHGVPAGMAYLSVGIGLMLTLLGAMELRYATAYTVKINFAAMITCVGLGIVLAAFGSRAAGTWKTWSVAGSGALAIILFFVQWECQPRLLPSLRGEIRGTSKFQQLSIWGSGPLFVTRRKVKGDFEFAAFPDDIAHTDDLSIDVTRPDGTEFLVYCVPSDLIRSHLGQDAALALVMRPDTTGESWHIYSLKKRFGRFNNDDCDGSPADSQRAASLTPRMGSRTAGWQQWFVGKAWAQSSTSVVSVPSKNEDLRSSLRDLGSNDADARYAARDLLSSQHDPASLHVIVDTWDTSTSTYRDDLGRLVAWNSAVKQDGDSGNQILAAMDPNKLHYVVALTGYPDATMRLQATSLVARMLQAWDKNSPGAKENFDTLLQLTIQGATVPSFTQPLRHDVKFSSVLLSHNALVALNLASCNVTDQDARKDFERSLAALGAGNLGGADSKELSEQTKKNLQTGCSSKHAS